jgi:hypothetical protein
MISVWGCTSDGRVGFAAKTVVPGLCSRIRLGGDQRGLCRIPQSGETTRGSKICQYANLLIYWTIFSHEFVQKAARGHFPDALSMLRDSYQHDIHSSCRQQVYCYLVLPPLAKNPMAWNADSSKFLDR